MQRWSVAAATVAAAMDPVGWGGRWTQEFRTHTAQVGDFALSFTLDMDGDAASWSVKHLPTGADPWRGIIQRGTGQGETLLGADIRARMWALGAALG